MGGWKHMLVCVLVFLVSGGTSGCAGGGASPNLEMGRDSGVGTEDGWWDGFEGSWMPLKPCKEDDDCESGYCLKTLADSVCAWPCTKDYKCNRPGWACFPVREPDGVKELCLPKPSMLCLPCTMDEECGPLDKSFVGLCVELEGQGRFCGLECIKNQDCPAGYVCKAPKTEFLVGQCQPKGGQCVCNEIGKKNVLRSPCWFENEFGRCEGEIFCPPSGPAKCSSSIPAEDLCDGLDNDCDGITDNGGNVGKICGLTNKGECSLGVIKCTDGKEVCEGAVFPQQEICDNLDNNCDGETDEDFPGKGEPCGASMGVCIPGKLSCKDGEVFCEDEMFGSPEVCDGLDNDCDGPTDEDVAGTGEVCGTNEGLCQQGTMACIDGEWVCEGEIGPEPEVCDGLDNDCDGSTDEDVPGTGEVCGTNEGLCQQGTMACIDGEWVCEGEIGPEPEVCDGLDNDCDGVTDMPECEIPFPEE